MAAELTGRNPVHSAVIDKARGAAEFCGIELAVLLVVLIGLWVGLNPLVGIAGVALCAVVLNLMRQADNGRRDHLELRLRRLGDGQRYRLVEPDGSWKPVHRGCKGGSKRHG